MFRILLIICKLLRPKGRISFIDLVVENGKILDVGCGNNSPYIFKTLRPDIYYVGIDIDIYNQSNDFIKYADEFVLAEPDTFQLNIEKYLHEFDAVICSHNLEHCDDYMGVTLAMLKSLKIGGTIYISFPCEESVNFPSRKRCLNFYDDESHKNIIPFQSYISTLEQNGMNITFATKRYRPFIPFLIGLICEPFVRLLNMQAPGGGTWAFYGFETVIIATKIKTIRINNKTKQDSRDTNQC